MILLCYEHTSYTYTSHYYLILLLANISVIKKNNVSLTRCSGGNSSYSIIHGCVFIPSSLIAPHTHPSFLFCSNQFSWLCLGLLICSFSMLVTPLIVDDFCHSGASSQ